MGEGMKATRDKGQKGRRSEGKGKGWMDETMEKDQRWRGWRAQGRWRGEGTKGERWGVKGWMSYLSRKSPKNFITVIASDEQTKGLLYEIVFSTSGVTTNLQSLGKGEGGEDDGGRRWRRRRRWRRAYQAIKGLRTSLVYHANTIFALNSTVHANHSFVFVKNGLQW